MDYEKLHKDTITKLQEMVNSGKITVETACGICADFVPESEDERIRKDIIRCLKHSGLKESNPINPHVTTTLKDAIAWLEKQGENNMGISEAIKQKLEDNLNKALEKETPESCNEFLEKQGSKKETLKERNICDTCEDSNECLIPCCAKLLEKQGEQKPAEFDDTNAKRMFIKALERVEEQNAKGYKLTDCDKNSWWEDFKAYTSCIIEQKPVIKMKTPEESLGIDSDTYNKIADDCIYGEQNTTWSKEDEMHIRELESLVKQVWTTAEHENDKDTIHKMSDLLFFLKTLKPQPKQEWSDVDKDILFRTIDNLKFLRDTISIEPEYAVNTTDIEREITWLKSLKERYTWRPSDEQISIIEFVMEDMEKDSIRYAVLNSVLEQLKKLREE